MSVRTPFSLVQGLGAAHSGTRHFWHERTTSVALLPLLAWFVYAALHMVGASYAQAFMFLHEPVNAIAMTLFVIASVIHMTLGLQVVIEDYVSAEVTKLLLFMANKAFGWIVGIACVFAMLRIAL